MKRIAVFILALILCTASGVSLFSCSGQNEEQILAEFRTLYEKSVGINEIIFGKGLPYDGEYEIENKNKPYYVKVSDRSPYKTKDELAAAVLEVYTEDYYYDVLENTLFNGYGENKDSPAPRYKEMDGVLMIDLNAVSYNIRSSRDVEKATVKKSTSGSAVISTPYRIEGLETESEKTITMFYTEGGWRFDDPSY